MVRTLLKVPTLESRLGNGNFSLVGGGGGEVLNHHFANLKSNLKVATFHFQGGGGGVGE